MLLPRLCLSVSLASVPVSSGSRKMRWPRQRCRRERRVDPPPSAEDGACFPDCTRVRHSPAGRIRARCPLPVNSRLLRPASPTLLLFLLIARWPTQSRKLILSLKLQGWCAVCAERRSALRSGCAQSGFRHRSSGNQRRLYRWRRTGFSCSRFRPGTSRRCAPGSGMASARERAA